MATDHNFKIKNGLAIADHATIVEDGSETIITSTGEIRFRPEGSSSNKVRISLNTTHISGSLDASANIDANAFRINGTTVIDSNRNLTNIGTINSGNISVGAVNSSQTITTSNAAGFVITNQGKLYSNSNNLYLETFTNGTGIVLNSRTGYLTFKNNGTNKFQITSSDDFNFYSGDLINVGTINTGQGATEVYLMNQNVRSSDSPTFQDLTIQGNLSITGDINSYNVTDLDVVDKTITLGVGGTASANDAGGIIVDGANAKLTWDNGDSRWSMNKSLQFHDGPTTTNQGMGIFFTGFDKEATSDYSDNASIIHTINTGGHTGSVLLFSSQNDANDGIAFITNGSSSLKHNSSNILTAANFASNITVADSTKLPLAGGTMTGNLTVNSSIVRISNTSGQSDLRFEAANDNFSQILFGDTDGTSRATLRYKHDTDTFFIAAGGTSSSDLEITNSAVNVTSGTLQISGTTVINSSRNLTNIGTISSGAITATGVATLTNVKSLTDLILARNDGTSPAVVIERFDRFRFITDSAGDYNESQLGVNPSNVLFTNNGYAINTTTVIDSSRNLTNIGTISSGSITSGVITVNNVASDKKISFNRTGGKNISIEHDANQIYFWNNTDSHFLMKMSNAGLVQSKVGFSVNGTTVIDSSRNLTNIGTITAGGDIASRTSAYPGGRLILDRTSSSSGPMTSSEIHFRAYGNNTTLRTFGKIEGRSTGYADGQIMFYTQNSGTLTETLTLDSSQNATFAGTITATGGNSTNWNTAYGWGNHASAGYLTSHQSLTSLLPKSGGTMTGTLDLNTPDSLSFESGKHWITYNDGEGNFNIRVGHKSDSNTNEVSTESGYVFHDEWSQSSGWREFNISASSIAAGADVGAWRRQIYYDNNSVYLAYQGSNKLNTSSGGISVNGTVTATGGNSGNWNTAYGWGDHSTEGYLTSFDITTQTDGKYLRSNANDTYTGILTFGNGDTRIYGSDGHPLVQVNSSRAYFGSTSRAVSTIATNSTTGLKANVSGTDYTVFHAGNSTQFTSTTLNGYATESYVGTQISNLVDSSPSALNTLNELAAALGDDANFSTTVNANIATKLPKAGGTMTGDINLSSTSGTSPAITFNTSSGTDTSVDMAIRATGEGLDFYEPEDTNKIHMRIVDDTGVNAVFGLRTGAGDGTARIDASGNLINIGNITVTGTVDGVDIAARNAVLTTTTTTANAALPASSYTNVFKSGSEIAGSQNLNNYRTTGYYSQDSNSDATSGSNYPLDLAGILEVITGDQGNGLQSEQRYSRYNNNQKFVRHYYNGTWTSWNQVWNSGDFANNSTNWNTAYTVANAALPKAGGTMTGTITGRDFKPQAGYHLQRSDHHSGHLEGSYNNIGDNGSKSNPIYTIGSAYNPADATLSNMYGIGYTHSNASFISMTGASGWGMYVAADGDARIYLGGSNGVISSTGEHYVGSSRVFHDTYHPNADTLTTARTINGVSFNGSANITVADSSKLPLTGGTVTGNLSVHTGGSSGTFSVGRSTSQRFKMHVTDGLGTIDYLQDESGDYAHDVNFNIISPSTHDNEFKFSDRIVIQDSIAGDATLLALNHDCVADLATQRTFIDFSFTDTNSNETPQVRIGAQVGANADAGSQILEGCGAFIIHTNNANTVSGAAGASLVERMRVDYQGNVGIGNTTPGQKLDVTGNIAVSGTVDGVDIAARNGVLTSTTTTANAALPKAGGTMSGQLTMNGQSISMGNGAIVNANNLTFNDPGVNEGVKWEGGNLWQIYESPDAQTNSAGNLQFTSGSGNGTKRFTITTDGYIGATRTYFSVDRNTGYFYNDSGTRTAYTGGDFYIKSDVSNCYLYATNTYMGASSGDTIRFRGNTVTADSWGITSAGAVTAGSYGPISGTTGTYKGYGGTPMVQGVNGAAYYHGSDNGGYGIVIQGGHPICKSVKIGSVNAGTTVITTARAVQNITSISMSGDLVMTKSQPWVVIENTTEDGGGIVFNDNQAGAWPAASSQAFRMTYHSGNNSFVMGHDENSYTGFSFASGGNFTASGDVTAYSDERLKSNIVTLDGKKVLDMRGVSFEKDGKEGSGVIAQELEKIAPELVHTNKEDGYKSVAYGNLVGYLIEAVKGQQETIEKLTSRINDIEKGEK